MVSNLAHNRVLHETTVVLSIVTSEAPRVAEKDRSDVEEVTEGVYQVVLTFGYADEPDVLEELRHVELEPGRFLDADGATFFLGRETVTATPAKSMARWREELFVPRATLAQNFARLPYEYRRPFEEMGITAEETQPSIQLPMRPPAPPRASPVQATLVELDPDDTSSTVVTPKK